MAGFLYYLFVYGIFAAILGIPLFAASRRCLRRESRFLHAPVWAADAAPANPVPADGTFQKEVIECPSTNSRPKP